MAKKFAAVRYTTYPFVDRDPILDFIETIKIRSGLTDRQVAEASKVSRSTLGNWRHKTKRPQFATVAAAANALGVSHLPITSEGRKGKK